MQDTTEDFILEEGKVIGITESLPWFQKIRNAFPAFEERNFRLYFFGQLISVTGTWLQNVALGWLVFQLTQSAFWVGTVAAITVFPTLLLSLLGGVIVDRFDKKKILYVTQASAMTLAFILGVLTILGIVTLWEVCLIAFLMGVVNALDLPALQSFVGDMVSKERLASAISLNSALTNSARALGPAVAGALINYTGVGWTFILNAASFIAVLIAFYVMHIENQRPKNNHPHPITMIKDGLRYTFSHPGLALFMYVSAVMAIFGYSYTSMFPVISETVFHTGPSGLGYLLSATGLGALVGAIIVSAFSKKISPKISIVGGNFLLGLGLFSFSRATALPIALLSTMVVGFSFTFEFSMINTLIQHEVSPEIRGRVLSILITMFLGSSFLGNFAIGYFSNLFGTQSVIEFNSLMVILVSAVLFLKRAQIIELKQSR